MGRKIIDEEIQYQTNGKCMLDLANINSSKKKKNIFVQVIQTIISVLVIYITKTQYSEFELNSLSFVCF